MGRRAGLVAAFALLLFLGPAGAAPSDDADDQALLADADYAAGLTALKAGDAPAALLRFQAALKRFPESADLHNELGLAHRQVRQVDKAFEHYKRALAINPLHRGAHEYIGEAYLMVGDVAGAEKHLASLRSICVLPCEEQNSLGRSIAAFRARAAAAR